ncbi:MAG: dTDP-4-dehydrorhamnose reductase [Ignavibacterium sp.]
MSSVKKILITGGSGFFGQYLNIEFSKKHKILTLYNSNIGNCNNFNSQQINITNYKTIDKIFSEFLPEIVIHSAAVSSVQKAEKLLRSKVFEINVKVTEEIAKLCDKYESKLIYISTDLVYDGYRGSFLLESSPEGMRKEDAKLIPASIYAETKLMGEIKIQNVFDNFIILRMALLYGFGLNHSKNHFQEIYYKLKNGKTVDLFLDQFRTPLSVIDSARMLSEICSLNLKNEIINFGGKERVSRVELGEILCDIACLDKNLINKIYMKEIPNLPIVEDVSMNIDKLNSFGIQPKTIEESINEILSFNK